MKFRDENWNISRSFAVNNDRRDYWLAILAFVTLLIGAYYLSDSGGYHRYYYYQNMRLIVFVSWLLAAYCFYRYKWIIASVLAIPVIVLFNPLIPMHMRKFEWQPYDHATMLLSGAAAIAIAWLTYKRSRPSSEDNSIAS